MKNVKVGDIIVEKNGGEAKVLAVVTGTFLKSGWDNFGKAASWYAFAEAEAYGWKIKETLSKAHVAPPGKDLFIFVDGERYRLIKE